ncbi:MAG: AzlD domain-containing protein [Acidimicrobiia bacterium]
MSTTALALTMVAMGVVTYASRALFLFRAPPRLGGYLGRFLDLFPLALFVSLAATGLLAPDGHLAAGPGLAALAAGAVAVWRRAPVWAVMLAGYAAAMVVRLV